MANTAGQADLKALLDSKTGKELIARGSVVGMRPLTEAETQEFLTRPEVRDLFDAPAGRMVLEHERIAFLSYPYEWPPEMLYEAAVLTLDLAQALLPEALGLKDATPYNILFRGPHPVFIDVLLFERRSPGDPTWLPYAQFVRTFLLPLLANKYYGLRLDQALARREGLEPEEVYRWTGPLKRLRPPFFSLVSMPAWLGGKQREDDASLYRKKLLADPDKARFILNALLKSLRRTLRRLQPVPRKSAAWSDYMTTNNNYTAEHFAAKDRFVREAVNEFRPRSVLDVGCNTGHFSAMAAEAGASVVSLDYDPVVLGEVWRNALARKHDILPLVGNITQPTPGMGWRNQECASFLDRARGRFDTVLMLAVIHHMLVTERVPLADIVGLAAELTQKNLIIEFISPEDSIFRRFTRGREELHKDLNHELFESLCARRFNVVRRQHVEGSTRWLYLMRKR